MEKELVSVEWLEKNLSQNDLIILDCSPVKTAMGKESPNSSLCIPNARIVDIKVHLSNKESEFPNTIPTESQFRKVYESLGIKRTSHLVVYDNLGIYTAPRVWWLFKIMGHKNISVLNGGLPEWIKKGYPTVKKSELNQAYAPGFFDSNCANAFVIEYEDVIKNIESEAFQIVDARSAGRFSGVADEPRKHLKSGSIPNSINIPYQSLLADGKYKSAAQLTKIFEEKITSDKKLVFSCGSGITACVVLLAYEIAVKKSRYLYDGSWTEYAELQKLIK